MFAPKFEITIYSDNALLISFDEESNQALTHYIYSLSQQIPKLRFNGFIETVSAYQSLLLIFEAHLWDPPKTIGSLEQFIKSFKSQNILKQKQIKVPVCYSENLAPDLEDFCFVKNISTSELIQQHTNNPYRVEMLGFLPGFLYLSGLDKALAHPRKETPNLAIPSGSIAIGGGQTGIYPIASPGGWHIIGRTPMTFFHPDKNPPIEIKTLDEIQFYAITEEEFYSYEH